MVLTFDFNNCATFGLEPKTPNFSIADFRVCFSVVVLFHSQHIDFLSILTEISEIKKVSSYFYNQNTVQLRHLLHPQKTLNPNDSLKYKCWLM